MRGGEREGPTRRREKRKIHLKEEERRTPLLCNTHGGYCCTVTLLSPRLSPYAEFTSLLEIQIPREMVVMLLVTLLLFLPCIYELNLSLSLVLCYILLVRYTGSHSFAVLRSSSILSFSLFHPPPPFIRFRSFRDYNTTHLKYYG